MRMAIFCAAIVFAATGVAIAKEKKVAISDAAALCSSKHSAKKPVPELDCSLTGTATPPAKPRLGYNDSDPWLVLGF
ncbi:hypothetical protein OOJ09_30300 [Mesorhizobium qingshengii]|uniref:DUF680 domain-containing protein n=1 Tax=Mesorhizobium qingshengii TaxID=1165689 RepID=A0ABT4R403_9HYPH|nr:hypothetical protein [Mesorhizobium qingshengii]MCZ8548479.1 hypothetical protein [Mesorhizobium qingshengii]